MIQMVQAFFELFDRRIKCMHLRDTMLYYLTQKLGTYIRVHDFNFCIK